MSVTGVLGAHQFLVSAPNTLAVVAEDPMAYDPVPKCPRCQGTALKLIREKHRWTEHSREPIATLSIYNCACGTGFTHMVKHVPLAAPVKSA